VIFCKRKNKGIDLFMEIEFEGSYDIKTIRKKNCTCRAAISKASNSPIIFSIIFGIASCCGCHEYLSK